LTFGRVLSHVERDRLSRLILWSADVNIEIAHDQQPSFRELSARRRSWPRRPRGPVSATAARYISDRFKLEFYDVPAAGARVRHRRPCPRFSPPAQQQRQRQQQ